MAQERLRDTLPTILERIGPERGLRLTLAVAGVRDDDLLIELVESQLSVQLAAGHDTPTEPGVFSIAHRGARQVQRAFRWPTPIEVNWARGLDNGTMTLARSRAAQGRTAIRTHRIDRGQAGDDLERNTIDSTARRSGLA